MWEYKPFRYVFLTILTLVALIVVGILQAVSLDTNVNITNFFSHVAYTHGVELVTTTFSTLTNVTSYSSGQDGSGNKYNFRINWSSRNTFVGCQALSGMSFFAAPWGDDTSQIGFCETSADSNYNVYKGCKSKGASMSPGWFYGTSDVFDKTVTVTADLDLSGAATDTFLYNASSAGMIAGYDILYTENSSADAGVIIRIGRYQDGVALDDDWFNSTTSEVSKNLGYVKNIMNAGGGMTRYMFAKGDTITVGTAGGKVGAGTVRITLKIMESEL